MSELDVPRFPENFVWGVSSAAYQMEGAVTRDGRGESIWDRFCATPGKVRNGESGAIACRDMPGMRKVSDFEATEFAANDRGRR